MKRTAIVTGICGQDGSYLVDLLLEKGYKVYGLKRRTSGHTLGCASHLTKEPDLEIVEGDVTDLSSLVGLCKTAAADEFYNLAAQSHVQTSFGQPHYTLEATAHGPLNCLEAIRTSGFHTRYYQASTSEMYGGLAVPQGGYTEESPFYPRSPYGAAKLYAHWITVNYRDSYRMHASSGILFNHESERRGPNFVTRKITLAIAQIKAGRAQSVSLGNLDAKRDWGHARDYVVGMWLMLQQPYPDDFVLCTGECHTVREFCEVAFAHAGLGDYRNYVVIDPSFYRKAEVNVLLGSAAKARRVLGWEPKIRFEELVKTMVDADISAIQPVAA